MKKMMMPMLIAYKLKFMTLVPMLVGKASFHVMMNGVKNTFNVILYMLINAAFSLLNFLLALNRAMPYG